MSLGKEFDVWSEGMGLTQFQPSEREVTRALSVSSITGENVKKAYIRYQVNVCLLRTTALLERQPREEPISLTDGAAVEVHASNDEQGSAIQLHFSPGNANGREFSLWFEQSPSGHVDSLRMLQTFGGQLSLHPVMSDTYTDTPFSEIRNTFATIQNILREARNTPQ